MMEEDKKQPFAEADKLASANNHSNDMHGCRNNPSTNQKPSRENIVHNPSPAGVRFSIRRRVPPKRLEDESEMMKHLSVLTPSLKKRQPVRPSAVGSRIISSSSNQTMPKFTGDDDPIVKPRHSYHSLITISLLSSPDHAMTLNDIYRYVSDRFAYYRNSNGNWQNGIRHALSASRLFQKIPRTDVSERGCLWTFAEDVNPSAQFGSIVRDQQTARKRSFALDKPKHTAPPKLACQQDEQIHPLKTLVLEQLQNAANGLYSIPLLGVDTSSANIASSLPQTGGSNIQRIQFNAANGAQEERIEMCGFPSMTYEQLAMAQSNWYIAQLATQRGFALVPEFYERCLKQIRAYYASPNMPSSSSSTKISSDEGNEAVEGEATK